MTVAHGVSGDSPHKNEETLRSQQKRSAHVHFHRRSKKSSLIAEATPSIPCTFPTFHLGESSPGTSINPPILI